MFQTLASQIGLALVSATCLFAAWAGGRPQKIVAAICFTAWIASAAMQDLSFTGPDYDTLVLDIVLMVVFVAMAIKSRRAWITGLAAFQTLTMASHFAMILDHRIWPKAAITAYLIWSYLVLACLFWGGVTGLLDRRRVAGDANREAGR
jgi:hypothetical protein